MKKVMIVDDSGFMRSIVRRIVEGAGYEVISEASNGLEAVEQYKIHQPDVVTMDITMPEMTGLEALKEIIAYDKDAKVIMATAMGQEAMIKESIVLGAKDFLVKPFDQEQVTGILKSLLN